jgi:hypothetical protein
MFALTVPTFAGVISTGKDEPPPPPAPTATATQGTPNTGIAGTISTGSSEAVIDDTLTQIALSLFQSVITLL